MTIIGSKRIFAVEYEKKILSQDKLYGHFALWACEQKIGEWEDLCDVEGILYWCRYFVNSGVDRHESILESLSKEEVFATIYDPNMVYKVTNLQPVVKIKDAASRFHISYLGMSSFADYFGVLLIEMADTERLIWANLQTSVTYGEIFPKGTVKEVTYEFSRDEL